ncbi:MAG: metallophosphoesterase [Lentisphaeria bacterium]|nr:metallophosphoesterase [Lentisphaeria bacterium]
MFFIVYFCTVLGFCLYSWGHLYQAFWRRHWITAAVAAGVMLLLTFLPMLNRMAFRRGAMPALELLAWIWLALIFWFSCTQLLADAWNLLLMLGRLVAKIAGARERVHSVLLALRLPAFASALAGLSMVLVAALWGVIEVGMVRLKTVEIYSEKVPLEADGYRIAVVSDLHFHHGFQNAILHKAIDCIREANPHLLLSAGDFLDGAISPRTERLFCQFAAVVVPDGKYGVLGNHDSYSGAEDSMQAHAQAGFKVLRQRGVDIKPWLRLYGIDDPAVWRRQGRQEPALKLPLVSDEQFGILLEHQPRRPEVPDRQNYDLMLSGHTHGGQIFPFHLLVRMEYPWKTGSPIAFPGGLTLYISPGTGFWGPPFRLLARPEVTLLVLRSAQPKVF